MFIIVLCISVTASAQLNRDVPDDVKALEIQEHLNEQIDLNLSFLDEDGNTVALRDYFKHGKPVVMNLVYYSCPMLCGMVTKGVVNTLRDIPMQPGKEFQVVQVSFDSRETSPLAKAKKEAVMVDYGRSETRAGWHFLVDKDDNARRLAEQIGFRYRWIEENKQFAHASVTFILTPEGKISRYLYGLMHEPRDMRLAITEASNGKVGSTIDRWMLYCYHYDPAARSYVPTARNIMKFGAAIVVALLATMLFFFWRREFLQQARTPQIRPDTSTTGSAQQ